MLYTFFYRRMTPTAQILAKVKQATDYQINKRVLKEKKLTDLHISFNGGLFKITPEIIGFVTSWPEDVLYIEDVYENPIEIEKHLFLSKAQQQYRLAMTTWYHKHEELKRIRKI